MQSAICEAKRTQAIEDAAQIEEAASQRTYQSRPQQSQAVIEIPQLSEVSHQEDKDNHPRLPMTELVLMTKEGEGEELYASLCEQQPQA